MDMLEVHIMRWKIAEAKQHLSAVVKAAQDEPQLISRRNELVAAVIGNEAFDEYRELLKRSKKRSLGEAFKEIRQICEAEDYALEMISRDDRVNPFVEALDDVSG
jgi:prevent-host-death family protein